MSLVKEKVVKSFYDGNSFGKEEPYSPEDKKKLEEDINTIYGNILAENPVKEKVAYISAGAPGAGKTTVMRQHRDNQTTSEKKVRLYRAR